MVILNGIIFFYIIQRISEMIYSYSNEVGLRVNHQAVEAAPGESKRMKLFHSLWFISLLIEVNTRQTIQPDTFSILIYFVLTVCLLVRIHTMEKLKEFWTIKILSMKNQKIVTGGLYRYIRHPNYLIVILEFIFLPLLFKAYYTLVIFSAINLINTYQRIKLEERILMSQTDYKTLFAAKKRLIPFFLTLLIAINFNAFAAELNLHYKSYDDAKKAPSFVKFESESTKFGLITSSFNGYAKDVVLNYDLVSDLLSKLEVLIPVKSLDTDVDGRNEKMYDKILEAEKYPNIIVTLAEKTPLKEGEQTINMIFDIKGTKITRPVKLIISRTNGKISAKGVTSISLKEAHLPDPSIAIAKVRDNFDLSFAVVL